MEINMDKLRRGEEGIMQTEQIRALAPMSNQSQSGKNLQNMYGGVSALGGRRLGK